MMLEMPNRSLSSWNKRLHNVQPSVSTTSLLCGIQERLSSMERMFPHRRWRHCWRCVVHCSHSCRWQIASSRISTTDIIYGQVTSYLSALIGSWCVLMVCRAVSVFLMNRQVLASELSILAWRGHSVSSFSVTVVTNVCCVESLLQTVDCSNIDIECNCNERRILASLHYSNHLLPHIIAAWLRA